MKHKVTCIMLVDDNKHDNFFHERVIKEYDPAITVIEKKDGLEGLDYLKSNTDMPPDLIFLDINMPVMNGWDFLQEYSQLDKELRSKVIIVMLTSSDNVVDIERVRAWNFISEYSVKPLTEEILAGIIGKYFIDERSKPIISTKQPEPNLKSN